MLTRLLICSAAFLLACQWILSSEGRDLTTANMAAIRGGAEVEDACCEFLTLCTGISGDCASQGSQANCESQAAEDVTQPGAQESCAEDVSYEGYTCNQSDTEHACVIRYLCQWQEIPGVCVRTTTAITSYNAPNQCTDDPNCP